MKGWQWIVVIAFIAAAAAGGAVLTSSVPGTPDIVQRFASAIATAEGFFLAGSRAQRNNNPGNVTSSFGQSTTGQDAQFPIFATVADGWQALYNQVYKMFYGGSVYYNPSMTISQVGFIYADGAHDPSGAFNWAANVAAAMGVTTDTPLTTLMS